MLDDLGLVPALQWQGREVARNSGIAVNVASEGVSEDLSEEYKTCYPTASSRKPCITPSAMPRQQPCVSPSARHRTASTSLSRMTAAASTRNLNVVSAFSECRRRLTHLGGTFHVQSENGRGTLIVVHLPVNAKNI